MSSGPSPYMIRVYRGVNMIHRGAFPELNVERARNDARNYFAWDGVTRVELIHPDGSVEEIRDELNRVRDAVIEARR